MGIHGQMSEKWYAWGKKSENMKIAEITSASLLRDFSMRTCSHLALLDKVAKAVKKYQSPHFRMEQIGNQYKDLAGYEEHLGMCQFTMAPVTTGRWACSLKSPSPSTR
jgi:hypothetical protein